LIQLLFFVAIFPQKSFVGWEYKFVFWYSRILAYFLIKLFEIYPNIPHNFIKKAFKICQNLRQNEFEYRL
jgi:hypothetical protein